MRKKRHNRRGHRALGSSRAFSFARKRVVFRGLRSLSYSVVIYSHCMRYKNRITIDPNIMAGKPVVASTRIPVELVLEKLARNVDVDAILRDYPRLTKEDIQAVLQYAHDVIKGEEVFPTT